MIEDNLCRFHNAKHEKENEEQQSRVILIERHHQRLDHQMKNGFHSAMNCAV